MDTRLFALLTSITPVRKPSHSTTKIIPQFARPADPSPKRVKRHRQYYKPNFDNQPTPVAEVTIVSEPIQVEVPIPTTIPSLHLPPLLPLPQCEPEPQKTEPLMPLTVLPVDSTPRVKSLASTLSAITPRSASHISPVLFSMSLANARSQGKAGVTPSQFGVSFSMIEDTESRNTVTSGCLIDIDSLNDTQPVPLPSSLETRFCTTNSPAVACTPIKKRKYFTESNWVSYDG